MLRVTREKVWLRLAQGVIGVMAIIVLLTFQHYGISWDEELQSQYGQAVFDYYASGMADRHYDEIFNLYLYGGMFDGVAALFDAYSPLGIYATRHLLNAAVGLFGLWGTWRLGRMLGGGLAGFAALLLLALTPVYYGHMFNNPKDIPFAAGMTWTMYYMVKSLRLFPHLSPSITLKLGIIFGLTLGIRVGGVMLMGYWGLALFGQAITLYVVQRRGQDDHKQPVAVAVIMRVALCALPVVVLTYAVMLICWPWAQESPLRHPFEAFVQFSNFPQIVEVLLDGVTYMSTELPWYYVPLYFSAQVPIPQLLVIALSLLALPWLIKPMPSADRFSIGLMLMTVGVPLGYATIRHPALYDAIRHFTFTLPLLCVIGGLGIGVAVHRGKQWLHAGPFEQSRRLIAYGAIGIAGFLAIAQINTMIRLHPYEYIFVNSIYGGVKGAFGKYELDYWGSSFKEAAERLQDHVASEGGVPNGKIYRIAICGPWSAAMIYLPPDYEAVEANKPADFFLSTTRWMCQNMRPGKEIIRVSRMGAPLSIVKDLREP